MINCVNYVIGCVVMNLNLNVEQFSCDRYPSLRVAYIDEVEEPSKDKSKKINEKVYYSTLVKAALPKSKDSPDPLQNLDQVKSYYNQEFLMCFYILSRTWLMRLGFFLHYISAILSL